jgi:hypothetical protein
MRELKRNDLLLRLYTPQDASRLLVAGLESVAHVQPWL